METIERLVPRNLLPQGTSWYVAGGYAAHKGLATDIDVWVVDTDPIYRRDRLLRWLREQQFDIVEHAIPDEPQENYVQYISTFKVATVTGRSGLQFSKPYHILTTTADAPELLNAFDISTHMIALRPDGTVVTGDYWTSLDMEPVVVMETDNTPARLTKITNRYAHIREAAIGQS